MISGEERVERTLMVIKPDAVADKRIGEIARRVEQEGFKITALKMTDWDRAMAGRFYAVHRGKPFYEELLDFVTSGPIVPMILERGNAVAYLREIVGATDPKKAAPGTIRHACARNVQQNAVHASDSPENAIRESAFFFPEMKEER